MTQSPLEKEEALPLKKPVAYSSEQTTGKELNYLPKIQANISGATMVASDSMT